MWISKKLFALAVGTCSLFAACGQDSNPSNFSSGSDTPNTPKFEAFSCQEVSDPSVSAELEKAKVTWNDETSVANQWSSSYCCMSFEQKLAQWGITSLDVSNIEAIKDVVDHNIEILSYIEHNRWNMEKLLLGFRKPHPDEQAEIDNSRREYADSDKLSKHDQYKRRHIHSYLCSFDDLADITWKGMDKENDDVRKIDYDMLRQLPWIIRNNN